MTTLTKKQAVQKLVDNDIDEIIYDIAQLDKISAQLKDIVLNGWIGYGNMSLSEIREEVEKWFGNNYKVEE